MPEAPAMAMYGMSGARSFGRLAAARCHPWPRQAARALTTVAGPAAAAVRRREPWAQARNFALVTQSVKDFGAESIKEGTLMEFKKKVGDAVSKGDIIASIETDKVTVDVLAEQSGVLKELLVKPDENVAVGTALFSIEVGAGGGGGGAAPAAAPAKPAAAAAAPAAGGGAGRVVEQKVKDFGAESIKEGTLMEWRKKVGEAVAKGEILAVIETDKVSVEVLAEEGGVVMEIFVTPDTTVQVGTLLAKIQAGGSAAPAAAAAPAAPAAQATTPAASADLSGTSGLRAGFARAAAARAGGHAPSAPAAAPRPAAAVAKPAAVPVSGGAGRTEHRAPMSGVRRRVAQRLKESQNTLALLSTFQEADVTASLSLIQKRQELFKKSHGADLGMLSFFIKACASGLMDIPGVNAVIDDASGEIVYRDYVDISVPIPSLRGPVSCTLRNCQSMSIRDIERALAALADKARKDKLTLDDLSEASFGIVDTGSCGGMMGTNFVNPPASAALGTNSVKKRAAVVDGKVVARDMMYLSLTYDHRLVDGREAATFLVGVRDKLEDPSRLLLEI